MGLFSNRKTAEELYADGEKYYENNDYFNAMQCYSKAASKNHVEAIYSLGHCYYYGQGVELNYVEAFKCYSRAANMGHTKALERLGVCYAEGAGVECDDDKAVRCWEQAVRQGSETAQEKIDIVNYYNKHEIELAGKLIYGVDGYEVDVQKGLDIVRKGINIGDCDAIYLMATQLISGLPPYICQNVEAGLNFIVEAAKKGSLSALYDLIGVHNRGDINGVQVELDDDSFGALILKIAEVADFDEYGGNWAYAYAAWACRYGYGTEKDLGKARTWVSKMDPMMQSVEFIKKLEL